MQTPTPNSFFSAVDEIQVVKSERGYSLEFMLTLNSSNIGDLQKSLEEHVASKPVSGKKLELNCVDYTIHPDRSVKKVKVEVRGTSPLLTHELAIVADRLRDLRVFTDVQRTEVARDSLRILKSTTNGFTM